MPIVRGGAAVIERVRTAPRAEIHPAREAEPIHDETEALNWQIPTSLAAPAPRPGYVQRWVRDTADGGDQNWLMKYREGWRPRALATIPNLTHYTRGMSTQGQEVARVGTLVLCEMPERVANQRKAHYAGLTKSQNASISKKDDDAANAAGQATVTVTARPLVSQARLMGSTSSWASS